MIKKILIANRGEIALRVIRTAREMGIATVAVYSEADRRSPHVRMADEAVCIGPASSAQSYLLADRILEACGLTGADAVHPGYGFLSENAGFARKVTGAGILFIGPPAGAIEMMGNKLAAKSVARQHDVPLVPGTDNAIDSIPESRSIVEEIGYPVLIKAAAGGGGKGMRIVQSADELEDAVKRAVSEAKLAFGDGSVFIEKYLRSPRHIEIQVMADSYGNAVYLYERECSIQRRHQKVIEEAPSAVVDSGLRKAMGESAVAIAKACGYTGAGTVEFMLDSNRNYYFLEMNTRLQVEHPVTEMITGMDLVREQIRIAAGERLPFTQQDVKISGHAIELRVYAEDPAEGFLPSTGKLLRYRPPAGPGVRVDDGFEEGMEVPVFYDPMLAKLIVHAPDRQQAIRRMSRAIREYEVKGVKTTLDFGSFVMKNKAFQEGNFDTNFVQTEYLNGLEPGSDDNESLVSSLISNILINNNFKIEKCQHVSTSSGSLWKQNRKIYNI